MKLAFVGKGGSGKTTLASLFARYLAEQGCPVLAIDADINQHLATALGLPDEDALSLPPLGNHLGEIKEYLRGDNPRISSTQSMVKTTPPGRGSRLLRVIDDPLYDHLSRQVNGIRLMVTGPFNEEDLGVSCYHSKIGAVELLLNHLVDGPREYVIVDMTAGADSFASGLFTRFDRTFLVCEPTLRSVGVYRQYLQYATGYDIPISVVGNKVEDDSDLAFLRESIGEDLLVCCGRSPYVRAMERGETRPLSELEASNQNALRRLHEIVDVTPQDWDRFNRQTIEFHVRNAESWANTVVGEDLTSQIDPEFALGPDALEQLFRPELTNS